MASTKINDLLINGNPSWLFINNQLGARPDATGQTTDVEVGTDNLPWRACVIGYHIAFLGFSAADGAGQTQSVEICLQNTWYKVQASLERNGLGSGNWQVWYQLFKQVSGSYTRISSYVLDHNSSSSYYYASASAYLAVDKAGQLYLWAWNTNYYPDGGYEPSKNANYTKVGNAAASFTSYDLWMNGGLNFSAIKDYSDTSSGTGLVYTTFYLY